MLSFNEGSHVASALGTYSALAAAQGFAQTHKHHLKHLHNVIFTVPRRF